MLIIAGTVDLKSEVRNAALEATRELTAETRSQRDCLDYVWAPDSAVPGRIYVFCTAPTASPAPISRPRRAEPCS